MTNAELVLAMWDGWHRRDPDAAFASLDPEIVWDASRAPLLDAAGVYRGHEGVATFWRRWLAAWEILVVPEPEVIESGDKVLTWIDGQVNRGRVSGIEVEQPPFGFLWTFRDGKVVRMELHIDRAEALAGLSR